MAYTPPFGSHMALWSLFFERYFLSPGGFSLELGELSHELIQLPKATALDWEKEISHTWGSVVWGMSHIPDLSGNGNL